MIAWLEEAEKLKQTKIRDKNRSEAGGDTTPPEPTQKSQPTLYLPVTQAFGKQEDDYTSPLQAEALILPGLERKTAIGIPVNSEGAITNSPIASISTTKISIAISKLPAVDTATTYQHTLCNTKPFAKPTA